MNVNNDKEGLTNKRKFAVVRTKGLDDLVENAQSKETKKQHNGWYPFSQVGINNMNILSLNIWLNTYLHQKLMTEKSLI